MGLTLSLVNTGTPSAYTARPGSCLHLFRRPHWDALQSEGGTGGLTLLGSSRTQPWGLGNGLMSPSIHYPHTWKCHLGAGWGGDTISVQETR